MKIEGKGKALAIFVGETDHVDGRPLYVDIVEKARSMGLAGATVTRGMMGFGANSTVHYSGILRLSEDLPVRIDIIDAEERIDGFLPVLDEMVEEGLVATWDVQIEIYRHKSG